MTRGDVDNKRSRTVAVRLTPDEYAAWDVARAESGRREMGAWVRAVVTEVVTRRRSRRRPGDLPRTVVPAVNAEAARQLVGVANNLNQLAHWANSEQRAAQDAELRRLLTLVEQALYGLRGTTVPASSTSNAAAGPELVDVNDDGQDAPEGQDHGSGRWRPRWIRRAGR